MNQAAIRQSLPDASPRFKTKIAFIYYLFTIAVGLLMFMIGGRLDFMVDIIVTAFYVAVKAVYYALTRAV